MRYILHIDMNAFFASVEEVVNPELKNLPIAVGGRTSRASVIASPNYIARKYGVKAGMPNFKAKKLCPNLIIVNHHFDEYVRYSNIFIDFIRQKLTNNIEIMSIDECFADITHKCKSQDDAINLAKMIQSLLYQNVGLKCSIGISYNKFLAKMGSDLRKPYGITPIFTKQDIEKYIWPLPIEDMFLIGASSSKKLRKFKIDTIRDLADKNNNKILKQVLGRHWNVHYLHAHGIGNDELDHSYNVPKSLSNSETLLLDTNNISEVNTKIEELTKSMLFRMNSYNLAGRRLSVYVKYPDFTTSTKNYTSPSMLDDYYQIVQILKNMYYDNFANKTIRLIGVGISMLQPKIQMNTMIFDNYVESEKIIEDECENIKRKINEFFQLDILDIASKKLK